jgi:hypothetical protein
MFTKIAIQRINMDASLGTGPVFVIVSNLCKSESSSIANLTVYDSVDPSTHIKAIIEEKGTTRENFDQQFHT